jgi:hypothetical protein
LDERLKDHIWHVNTGGATRKNNWIKSLKKKGLFPIISLIEEVHDDEWEEKEKYYIALGWQECPEDMLNDPNAPGGRGSNFANRERYVKKYIHKRYTKTCPVCKNEFVTKRDKIVHCSKKCSAAVCYEKKIEKMKSANSRLSSTDLETIMARISSGEFIKNIALDYGVWPESISRRLKGKTSLNLKLEYKANKGPYKSAKLNWDVVSQIRKRYEFENITQKRLSEEYKIDASIVSEIIANKRWINNQGEKQ